MKRCIMLLLVLLMCTSCAGNSPLLLESLSSQASASEYTVTTETEVITENFTSEPSTNDLDSPSEHTMRVLESEIRRKLRIDPNEPISEEDFLKIESLSLIEENIVDVSPIAQLKNLKFLCLLKNYELVKIDTLANLTKLKELDLSYTNVSDLSALQFMTSLEILDLLFTPVSDLSALSNLRNLRELNLYETSTQGLEALMRVAALERLVLIDSELAIRFMNGDVDTLDQYERFKIALPNCKVIWK